MKKFQYALIPLAMLAAFGTGPIRADDTTATPPPADSSAAPAASDNSAASPAASDSGSAAAPAAGDNSAAPASAPAADNSAAAPASAPSSDNGAAAAPAAAPSSDTGTAAAPSDNSSAAGATPPASDNGAAASSSSGSSDTSTSGASSTPSESTSGGEAAASSGTSGSGEGNAASSFDYTNDRRFYLAPMFTYTLADKGRGTGNGLGGTVAFGKRVTRGLELELIGIYSHYKTKAADFSTPQPSGTNLYGGGLGANIYLMPSSQSLSGLFLHLDVLRGEGEHQPGLVGRDAYPTTIFDAGLGYNMPLNFSFFGLFDKPSVRMEALYRQDSHNEGTIGNNGNGHYFTEAAFNIGLRLPFGAVEGPKAEAPPEPSPQVVPEVAPPPAPPPPPPPPCQPPGPGQHVDLSGCKTGDTIVLHGVNFDFNKATLTLNAKALLDEVADALSKRPDIKVEIDGHTDGKGGDAYNQKLSERRAASVKNYLVTKGVDAGRMTTKGFGKSMPIADNNTDEGREQNRRVELKVTESNAPTAPAASDNGSATPAAAPSSAPASSESPAPAPADSGTPPPASDSGTPPASGGGDTPASQSGPPGETPPTGAAPQ